MPDSADITAKKHLRQVIIAWDERMGQERSSSVERARAFLERKPANRVTAVLDALDEEVDQLTQRAPASDLAAARTAEGIRYAVDMVRGAIESGAGL